MWALRVLNGPQAGQIYILKEGKHKIGRSPSVQFQLQANGVSKEHLELNVLSDKILVTDLKSSNGTYLNGVRIQNAIVRLGDKLSVDKIFFDIVMAPGLSPKTASPTFGVVPSSRSVAPVHFGGPAAAFPQGNYPQPVYSQPPAMHEETGHSQQQQQNYVPPMSMQQKFNRYMDEVVLPGIYRLPEVFEFRSVVFGFGVVFIFAITLLSIFPMNQITAESISTESRRRALTVARALANANERIVRQSDLSGFSADLVLREEGIDDVYIVSKEGTIIAPPERAGSAAKEAGFIQQIRGQTREVSAEIGSGQIAASVPILVFDPDLQQNTAKAHAVVIYNMGSLKFDDGRALSLFIQMLVIAMLVGFVVFFLLYKMIEYPLLRLNKVVDEAMREGKDHANVNLKFPILQQLLVSINSLLSRAQQVGGVSSGHSHVKEAELISMVKMMGYPAMLVNRENVVVYLNESFESLTGMSAIQVQGQSMQFLQDAGLQSGLANILGQARSQSQILQEGQLNFAGTNFKVCCQAVGSSQDPEYFVFSIMAMDQIEGGAA